MIFPIANPVITSAFGIRIYRGKIDFHNGFDLINSQNGDRIYSVEPSIVLRAGADFIVMRSQANPNITYKYIHLTPYNFSPGQYIGEGQEIGRLRAIPQGKHIHFEVLDNDKYINPFDFFSWSSLIPSHRILASKIVIGIIGFLAFIALARHKKT